jgi:hypothetical protein
LLELRPPANNSNTLCWGNLDLEDTVEVITRDKAVILQLDSIRYYGQGVIGREVATAQRAKTTQATVSLDWPKPAAEEMAGNTKADRTNETKL